MIPAPPARRAVRTTDEAAHAVLGCSTVHLALLVAATVLAGCATPEPSANAAEAIAHQERVMPSSEESIVLHGTVHPVLLVATGEYPSVGTAAFPRSSNSTLVVLTVSQPPTLAYGFKIFVGERPEPAYEENYTDSVETTIVLDGWNASSYRIEIHTPGIEAGFDWTANVTQLYPGGTR